MAYVANQGRCPRECEIRGDDGDITGFRSVHVRLRNGYDSKKASASPWPAGGGRPSTRWTLLRHAFDILEWEIT